MPIEIKWTDTDPETDERRFLKAEKFAGEWHFFYRKQRRDVRWLELTPTREMWEHVLDSLHRRYRRREGVDDDDVKQVERVLRAWKAPPPDEDSP
jgi:hypothetical protein